MQLANSLLLNIAKRAAVLLIVAMILTPVVRFALGAVLIVDLSRMESIENTSVFLNNEPLLSKNTTTKTFRANDVFGKQGILVKRAGYRDYKTSVSAYFHGTKVITPDLEKLSAEETAKNLSKSKQKIINPVFADNNTWLAYMLEPDNPANYTKKYIYVFRGQKWELYYSNDGSGLLITDAGQPPQNIIDSYMDPD